MQLLRVGDVAISETAVICECIEQVEPAVPLQPAAPLDRARHRGWTEFASAFIADVFFLYGTRRDDIWSQKQRRSSQFRTAAIAARKQP